MYKSEIMNLHRSRRVLLDDGSLCDAGVLIADDGTIVNILRADEIPPENCRIYDHDNLVIMPGIVDSHVHLNEPGRTHWEGFWTGTRAAAAGGVTTVVDMPLNSIPPTTTVEALQIKRAAAGKQNYVDLAFWGGVIPTNIESLQGLVDDGVVGFKCFLVDSGVPEFPAVTEQDVTRALEVLRGSFCPLAFHAELETQESKFQEDNDNSKYDTFLKSRPAVMENRAVELVAKLCETYSSPCHVVHVSSAASLDVISAARARGAPLTAETCPHYLSLVAEEVPCGATHYKCCPPVRNAENREHLWRGLLSKQLQLVVSDHSPCIPELKNLEEGDFMSAWGGISSLQFGLAITWTAGHPRGLQLADIARLMCREPARLCGLEHRKGRLAKGCDADLVIWDPDEHFQVNESIIEHRHKITPYAGLTLQGRVHYTVVRGTIVYDKGTIAEPPNGELLKALHTRRLS
ncbi:hypothetical protein B566_EDAN006366 [Ephemera danica]|nr:hypothetical protein B566_EDAN006366 [Ephemera danica]